MAATTNSPSIAVNYLTNEFVQPKEHEITARLNFAQTFVSGGNLNIATKNLALRFKRHRTQIIFFANLDTVVAKNCVSGGDVKIDIGNGVLNREFVTGEIFSFPARLRDFLSSG